MLSYSAAGRTLRAWRNGRRSRLKICRSNTCRFESDRPHHPKIKDPGRPCEGRGPCLRRAARRRSREPRRMCQPSHQDGTAIGPCLRRGDGGFAREPPPQTPSPLRRQGPMSASCCAAAVTGGAAHVSATPPGRSSHRPLPPQGRRWLGHEPPPQTPSPLRRQGPMSASCCAAAVTGAAAYVSAIPPGRYSHRPLPPQARRWLGHEPPPQNAVAPAQAGAHVCVVSRTCGHR